MAEKTQMEATAETTGTTTTEVVELDKVVNKPTLVTQPEVKTEREEEKNPPPPVAQPEVDTEKEEEKNPPPPVSQPEVETEKEEEKNPPPPVAQPEVETEKEDEKNPPPPVTRLEVEIEKEEEKNPPPSVAQPEIVTEKEDEKNPPPPVTRLEVETEKEVEKNPPLPVAPPEVETEKEEEVEGVSFVDVAVAEAREKGEPSMAQFASFKEESNRIKDLSEREKKALDELKELIVSALAKHEFSKPPPPPSPPQMKEDTKDIPTEEVELKKADKGKGTVEEESKKEAAEEEIGKKEELKKEEGEKSKKEEEEEPKEEVAIVKVEEEEPKKEEVATKKEEEEEHKKEEEEERKKEEEPVKEGTETKEKKEEPNNEEYLVKEEEDIPKEEKHVTKEEEEVPKVDEKPVKKEEEESKAEDEPVKKEEEKSKVEDEVVKKEEDESKEKEEPTKPEVDKVEKRAASMPLAAALAKEKEEEEEEHSAKTVEAIEETIVQVSVSDVGAASNEVVVEVKVEEEKICHPPPEEVFIWGIPLIGDEQSDTLLLKFLRARDFKVKDTFTMIKNTVTWRKEFGIEELLNEDLGLSELEKVVFTHGLDKEGHPVCYNVYGAFQDKDLYQKAFGDEEKRRNFLRWRVQVLEKDIREKLDFSPGSICALIQVTDLKNSPGKKELRQVTKQTLALLQDNYPELVAKQIFINVSWWYLVFNRMISPLFTARTKSKFVFAGPSRSAEMLFKYIAPEQVPVKYGGLNAENDTEFCTSDVVTDISIKPSTKHTIEILVTETCTLVWELRVLGWDVSYGVEFVPDAESAYTVIIQKSRKFITSDEFVMKNNFKICEPGKVVIYVDNATSKKKKLFYRHKIKTFTD